MKKSLFIAAAAGLVSILLLIPAVSEDKPAAGGKSAAELEKEKAQKNPYPNDFGPDSIDVSAYPKELQQSYRTFKFKCAACHTAARPLNSQILELSGPGEGEVKKKKTGIF